MKKKSSKPFRFGLAHIIRFTIFVLCIYWMIQILSESPTSPVSIKIPSLKIIEKLPPRSQEFIKNLPNSSVIINIQQKLSGFPDRQIKELKKSLIESLYQDVIDSIEKS